MDADPKRMSQACRIYAALLRCYPLSFQQEYGATLAQQFRDEFRDVLASGKSLFRFWVFISFDFMRSLLMETQEEVVKMSKKNLPFYSTIITGVFTLITFSFTIFDLQHRFSSGWIIPFFLLPLMLIFGALALLGLTRARLHTSFFWLLSSLTMAIAGFISLVLILSLAGSLTDWRWVRTILNGMVALFGDEDRTFSAIYMGYYGIIAVFSIGLFVKRQWLPGMCLFGLAASWLLAYNFILSTPDWFVIPVTILATGSWFIMAWWLKQESAAASPGDSLETV